MTSAERLDKTYRSILEKFGLLQSTITALWELAGMSQEVNQSFRRESRELVTDMGLQLDAFGRFEEQQQLIEQLQDRVQRGRSKITGLSERIDGVRDRIERWERADREWQDRTRRRLKVIWVITSVIILCVVLLVLVAQYAPVATLEEATTRFANESLDRLRNHTKALKGAAWGPSESEERVPARTPNFTTGPAAFNREDMDLRIFDEL
jgi:hypothetical protein